MNSRAYRLTVPVAVSVAVLAGAAPAWASTVQIQDDAHVLNATVVQNDAATLPVGVYIWATTQDAASKSTFDTDVRNKVSATFPIVLGINTQSRHESIQIGSQAGISRNAALAAESNANSAFVATMQSSRDYTSAVTAALDNLRSTLTAAHRGRAPAQRVVTHSVGIGLLPIILVLGAIDDWIDEWWSTTDGFLPRLWPTLRPALPLGDGSRSSGRDRCGGWRIARL
jgi:hypothetical protein